MTIKNRWLQALMILALAAGGTALGLRLTHQAALAKTPAILVPSGCPSAPALKTGLLAQSTDLKLPSTQGLPPNSVELDSFQWGVGRGISSPTGGSDREQGPSVSEITIKKTTDAATPLLFQQSVDGTLTDWTLWDYSAKGTDGAPACMKLELKNVVVSSIQMRRRVLLQQGRLLNADGTAPETLTLNFTKITMTNLSNKSSFTSPDTILWSTQGNIVFHEINL